MENKICIYNITDNHIFMNPFGSYELYDVPRSLLPFYSHLPKGFACY